MADALYYMPSNCDFGMVYNASNQEYDCSPKLKDKFFSPFSGLLINAPKEVVWPKNVNLADFPPGPSGDTDGPLRLMVAGLGRVNYNMLGLKGNISDHVLMVAVNQKTAEAYSGRMPKPSYMLEPPPGNQEPDKQDENIKRNLLLSSHFNFDLVHDLGIPIADATYTLYATFGDFKSNILTVTARVEK